MPGGFFLGGVFMYSSGGDPGLGIFLVPVGAIALFIAVLLTASGAIRKTSTAADSSNSESDDT